MKYYILLAIFLSSCAMTPKQTDIVNVVPQNKIEKAKLPTELKQECPEIEKWKDETFGSIVSHDVDLMQKYTNCRNKNKQLIDAWDKQQ